MNLRSSSKFANAVANCLELVFGPAVAADMEEVEGPSQPTFSRASSKLDLAHMILRRRQWKNWIESSSSRSIQLSSLLALNRNQSL